MTLQTWNIYRVFLGVLFLGLLIGGVWFTTQSRGSDIPQEQYVHWSAAIQKYGPTEAYEQLAEATRGESISKQHTEAHYFGGALFQEMGVAGFPVCDEQFFYGCFHEFIAVAITTLGLDVVRELNKTCVDTMGEEAHFCQHGVGHGIQSFFGYSENDLKDAIEVCVELPENDPIGGCLGGIFMEYNFRTMLADEATVRESDDIVEFCHAVPHEAFSACVFWAPNWWQRSSQLAALSLEERYREMGRRCREDVGSEYLQELCFRGLGTVVFSDSESNPQLSDELCRLASTTSTERFECHSSAAGIIAELVSVGAARHFCANLIEQDTNRCIERSGL